MYSKALFLFLILFALSGCRKEDETRKPGPGYFLLTEIKNPGLKNTRLYAEDSAKTTFELGDLKASREFYFLLSNGGDNPIFNIHLESDHPQFIIAPESISELPGRDSSGVAAFIPLISLGIIHGIQLNGVGYTDLLPMDENSAILTITGRTIDNGDTVDLKSDFDFSVHAKKMDVRLFENEQEIDLTNPFSSAMFSRNYGGLGSLRFYNLTSGTFTLQNTGNVDIRLCVEEMDDQGNYSSQDERELPQHQSVEIHITQAHVIVILDSDGAVTDDARIQLGNDGKGYFAILIYSE